jgi:hypothetical protein
MNLSFLWLGKKYKYKKTKVAPIPDDNIQGTNSIKVNPISELKPRSKNNVIAIVIHINNVFLILLLLKSMLTILIVITPQAGDFMSVFQRVKFPLTWLVRFQVSLTLESLFKIKYQIRPTKPPKSAKTRFINALLK